MTPEQLKQFNEMYEFMQSLKADTTVPLEVNRALISNLEVPSASVSNKPAGDAATVADGVPVSKPVDGFVTLTVNGTPRNIPYFD